MEERQEEYTPNRIELTSTEFRVPFIERLGISPVLFAFLSLIFIFVLYQIVGGIITIVAFGYKPTNENVTGYRVATGLGQILFILIPTLILVRLVSFNPKEYLRLKSTKFLTFIIPLVGMFSLQQMLQVYMIFQERIPLPEQIQSIIDQFKDLIEEIYKVLVASNSVSELSGVIIIVALIPAVAEEFLFRGLIQRNFEKNLTPLRSAIVTGIIFGAYHMNPFSFVPLAVIGIYLGFLTMRTGSLWVSVGAHFFNNFLACFALFLKFEDDYVILGNASEMSPGILLFTFWAFGVIFFVSMYYFLKITKPTITDDDVYIPNQQ